MTTECHEIKCKNHSAHIFDDGPFCDEPFCNYTPIRWYHRIWFKLNKVWYAKHTRIMDSQRSIDK
jgi:hypothetical protein